MPSAKSSGSHGRKSPPEWRNLAHSYLVRDRRGREIAAAHRIPGDNRWAVYLAGRDEPQDEACASLTVAVDYIRRWLDAGMPEPADFRLLG